MPVDTPDHALLLGYCPGTLSVPQQPLDPVCPVCGYAAGMTVECYVAHHVQEPGPRALTVDEDESLVTVDAINTPTPGLLLGRRQGCDEDRWQVFHAPTGLVVHQPEFFFPRGEATAMVCHLGTLTDWQADVEDIRNDAGLALVCKLAFSAMQKGLTRQ